MQISKDNLTIIIVTLKSDNVIDGCLKSISPEIKKIVVENSSNFKFVQKLEKTYKNIKVYPTGKNLGMGSGNNFGIKKSKTRYVLILNPDTILKTESIDKMLEVCSEVDFAILSPINEDPKYPNFKFEKNKKKTLDNLFEVDYVDGFAMMLDTHKFDGNFFDENFFMYLENDDLCLRMKKKGEKIYICKKSRINHIGANAVDRKYLEEIEISRNWHWNWSKFYYRKKHFGFLNAFFKGFPSYLKSVLTFIIFFIFNNKKKSKIYYSKASGFYNSLINRNSWYRPNLD